MNSEDDFERQFIASVKNPSQGATPSSATSQPISSSSIASQPSAPRSKLTAPHFTAPQPIASPAISQSVASSVSGDSNHSPLPLIISIALAIIVVLQSIALIVLVNNHFAMFNDANEEYYEETSENAPDDNSGPYLYNDQDYLIAMAATCTAEDGSYLHLTKNNNFEEYGIVSAPIDPENRVSQSSDSDKTSSLVDSGTYSITRDSVFIFNKSSGAKTLFFDGYTLTDGTVFYDCEEIYEDAPAE